MFLILIYCRCVAGGVWRKRPFLGLFIYASLPPVLFLASCVGYVPERRAYRLYNLTTRCYLVRGDVRFAEFPSAGGVGLVRDHFVNTCVPPRHLPPTDSYACDPDNLSVCVTFD